MKLKFAPFCALSDGILVGRKPWTIVRRFDQICSTTLCSIIVPLALRKRRGKVVLLSQNAHV